MEIGCKNVETIEMESRLAVDIGVFQAMPAVHAASVIDFVVAISGTELVDTIISHFS